MKIKNNYNNKNEILTVTNLYEMKNARVQKSLENYFLNLKSLDDFF